MQNSYHNNQIYTASYEKNIPYRIHGFWKKVTLGLRLAQKAGLSFIDLDHYIETRFRKTINEIFAEKGEKEFRIIERNMLREVGEFEDVIIATGGGAPCFF